MARPDREGLEYFSLDVDMPQDDKIYFIEAKHGLIGFAVVVRLLMRIYKNSYYCLWSEKEALIFSKQLSADINVTLTIVNDCINEGIFNKELYDKHGILTSKGIQKRYFEATLRRKRVEFYEEYLLIDVEKRSNVVIVTLTPINVCNNEVNVDITSTFGTQSKVKERESKVKERESIQQLCVEVEKVTCGKWFLAKETDKLNSLFEIYEKEWVREAIITSAGSKKYDLKYAEGILKNWVNEGKENKSGNKQDNKPNPADKYDFSGI